MENVGNILSITRGNLEVARLFAIMFLGISPISKSLAEPDTSPFIFVDGCALRWDQPAYDRQLENDEEYRNPDIEKGKPRSNSDHTTVDPCVEFRGNRNGITRIGMPGRVASSLVDHPPNCAGMSPGCCLMAIATSHIRLTYMSLVLCAKRMSTFSFRSFTV